MLILHNVSFYFCSCDSASVHINIPRFSWNQYFFFHFLWCNDIISHSQGIPEFSCSSTDEYLLRYKFFITTKMTTKTFLNTWIISPLLQSFLYIGLVELSLDQGYAQFLDFLGIVSNHLPDHLGQFSVLATMHWYVCLSTASSFIYIFCYLYKFDEFEVETQSCFNFCFNWKEFGAFIKWLFWA